MESAVVEGASVW